MDIQSLFVTALPLETNPVRGLQNAVMEVPGVPPYKVVSRQGGPCGPEVFSLTAAESQAEGITAPIHLVVLEPDPMKGEGRAEALARRLAALHAERGLRHIEVFAEGGPADARGGLEAASLDGLLREATGGACSAATPRAQQEPRSATDGGGDGDDLDAPDALLLAGGAPNHIHMVQALQRLAFTRPMWCRTIGRPVYLLVPGDAAETMAAGWRAFLVHDSEAKSAIRNVTVEIGRRGRHLSWSEVPAHLRRVVGTSVGGSRKRMRAAVAAGVQAAVSAVGESWDVWYGRLLALREQGGTNQDGSVPYSATVHGQPLGAWVARQLLEWRYGGLDADRRERLLAGGLSLAEEAGRTFAEGLEEFERYVQAKDGDPFVPDGHFTQSGFALGSWSLQMRGAWRRDRLSVEQQHLLDAVGFTPVSHPEEKVFREVTMQIEAQLREAQGQQKRAREKTFVALVMKHHPSRSRPGTTRGNMLG